MEGTALLQVAGLVVLGILAQWMGWRLRLPSILFLLGFGLLAGPVTGLFQPDEIFGTALMPIVSLSVALILFEGGLSLRMNELSLMGQVAWKLVTVRALVTWILTTAAAYFLLGAPLEIALLIGAILVVTGPTVVGPLLRHIRPSPAVGSVLKWEGILIDPVGAVLAVLVFEAVLAGRAEATGVVILGVTKALVIGIAFGGLAAAALLVCLRRYWIPDHLQNAATLALVLAVFTVSNLLQKESGLITVTLMGFILANQTSVMVRHVIEFKENLRVLLLSTLFVLLAARLEPTFIKHLHAGTWLFLGAIILVIRPFSVFVCTVRSRLTWPERLLASWMAPRGIVAAAIASVFALEFEHAGITGAGQIVPVVFLVVGATVLVYGFTAAPLARLLGVSQPSAKGVLLVGAHALGRQIGKVLQDAGIPVVLVDTNWGHVRDARLDGLRAYYGDALSDDVIDRLPLDELGRLLALTDNDQVNSLAALHFADIFGRMEVYQLPPSGERPAEAQDGAPPSHLRGRILFGRNHSYQALAERLDRGAVVKNTKITEEFTYQDLEAYYESMAIPLFALRDDGTLQAAVAGEPLRPQPGHRLIFLAQEPDEDARAGEGA